MFTHVTHQFRGVYQVVVVGPGQLDAGEQIRHYPVEQRHVFVQEFRRIHVQNGPQQQYRLVAVRVFGLQVAGRYQNRLHGSHTCNAPTTPYDVCDGENLARGHAL